MSTKGTRMTRRVSLYLPPDLHRRLKVRAAETDTSASALVERYIREGLLRDRPDVGPPPLPNMPDAMIARRRALRTTRR